MALAEAASLVESALEDLWVDCMFKTVNGLFTRLLQAVITASQAKLGLSADAIIREPSAVLEDADHLGIVSRTNPTFSSKLGTLPPCLNSVFKRSKRPFT
jgi:hypothetical protein